MTSTEIQQVYTPTRDLSILHPLPTILPLYTYTKLLPHVAVSPKPNCVMMSTCCSHSNSSMDFFYVKCRLHVSGRAGMVCYLALSAMRICHQNTHPMNASLNSLCNCCVSSALMFLSAFCWGPIMTVGLSLLFEFVILSVFILLFSILLLSWMMFVHCHLFSILLWICFLCVCVSIVCSWLLIHLGFLCLTCLAELHHFLAL